MWSIRGGLEVEKWSDNRTLYVFTIMQIATVWSIIILITLCFKYKYTVSGITFHSPIISMFTFSKKSSFKLEFPLVYWIKQHFLKWCNSWPFLQNYEHSLCDSCLVALWVFSAKRVLLWCIPMDVTHFRTYPFRV